MLHETCPHCRKPLPFERESSWEGWKLSPGMNALIVGEQTIEFPAMEFQLIAMIFYKRGEHISREQLYYRLYGHRADSSMPNKLSLSDTIYRIRNRLGEAGFPSALATRINGGFYLRPVARSQAKPQKNHKGARIFTS